MHYTVLVLRIHPTFVCPVSNLKINLRFEKGFRQPSLTKLFVVHPGSAGRQKYIQKYFKGLAQPACLTENAMKTKPNTREYTCTFRTLFTVYPGSSDSFYITSLLYKWVITSWTYCF